MGVEGEEEEDERLPIKHWCIACRSKCANDVNDYHIPCRF